MSLKNQKRYLAILDVGHGNAAVLRDEGGVVVFDTGRGAYVDRHLKSLGVHEVEAVFLSHADSDHIGGAITLLMNKAVQVSCVFLNPDPSKKDTEIFRQLRLALCDAEKRTGTIVEPSLTTNTKLSRKGAEIEVLYPPPSTALGGVGGRDLSGNRLTSNSLSAAIRISSGINESVLLGGDIEFCCLDEWKRQGVLPIARVLVFPHHGGLPGDGDETEAALFAFEMASRVKPTIVVFSNHRTMYGIPRDEVLNSIKKVSKNIWFVCTQLPDRFHPAVMRDTMWSLHRCTSGKVHTGGTVELELTEGNFEIHILGSYEE